MISWAFRMLNVLDSHSCDTEFLKDPLLISQKAVQSGFRWTRSDKGYKFYISGIVITLITGSKVFRLFWFSGILPKPWLEGPYALMQKHRHPATL